MSCAVAILHWPSPSNHECLHQTEPVPSPQDAKAYLSLHEGLELARYNLLFDL